MSDSHPPSSLLRRAVAVAVGLFATWHLIFLPAANLIDLVPRRPYGPQLEAGHDAFQTKGTFTDIEPIQRAAECTGDVLDGWQELSGLDQGWPMFTPGPPPYSLIPAIEFHFADGTSDTLLSRFEPIDKRRPAYRTPLLDNRFFNFEAQFTFAAWYAPPEEVAKHPEVYRDLPDAAYAQRRPLRAWLAWNLKQYQAAHPERGTPTEVIMKNRYIPIPKPDEPPEWTQPVQERPYAKWRPADDSFEVYDAVNHRFLTKGAKP
jgi:hypothetical protein